MNKCIKDFAKTMIDSVEEGTNPVIATSVFTGYLQAQEDLKQITPTELVDIYYDFSVKVAKTAFPDVSTDKEALETLCRWKKNIQDTTLEMIEEIR